MRLAVMIPRNIAQFPLANESLTGTIDVWWVVHDGGMLILLAFLLQSDKVWKRCRLRVFTVARVCRFHCTSHVVAYVTVQIDDHTIQLERDLAKFMYSLRIDADVAVIEMVRAIGVCKIDLHSFSADGRRYLCLHS